MPMSSTASRSSAADFEAVQTKKAIPVAIFKVASPHSRELIESTMGPKMSPAKIPVRSSFCESGIRRCCRCRSREPVQPEHSAVIVYSIGAAPPLFAAVGGRRAFQVSRGLFHGFQPDMS